MKEIKVEWCENWIKARFAKLPDFANGIYTELFWKDAEKSGLYTKGTYNGPMSKALHNLCWAVDVVDERGWAKYSVFKLKGAKIGPDERLLIASNDPESI